MIRVGVFQACDGARLGLASAAMKRTRFVLGAALVSSLFWLVGCGQGTYRIPAVEPVVKPKPENDLLEDIEGGDSKSSGAAESNPAPSATPAEKPPEPKPADAKPEEPKPEAAKAAEPPKADAAAAKAAPKPAKGTEGKAGKASGGKPAGKK